jgi:hypothetical protein
MSQTVSSVVTIAPLIVSTAQIAELSTAYATHVVTAINLFNPNCALGALLELRPLHKLLKGLVEQIWITIILKFFA